MSTEKEDLRRATGAHGNLAETSSCDRSLGLPNYLTRASRKESDGGLGVGKASGNFIPGGDEQRLLRYEYGPSSRDALKTARRCRGEPITCFRLPVCPAVAVVAVVLLAAAMVGLALVVSGLHDKVYELETKITKCAGENSPSLRVNHLQRFEAFNSAEDFSEPPESLFDKTVQLINKRYDNDESELTMEAPAAVSTTRPIGYDMETRDYDVIKTEGILLSRVRRDATQRVPNRKKGSAKQLNQTTSASTGARGSHEKSGNLDSSHFEMDFYKDWYDHLTNFSSHECIIDERWPTKPEACRGTTIRYPESDSPLAFYVPRKNVDQSTGHKKRKRKNNQSPMEIRNQTEGVFAVRDSGVYLIHLNITIVDESRNHSLGISLNNQVVLTCPKGGFRCPHINEEGSYKYRVCVIDGVLEMNPGDRLQIKTMERDTMVKFHSDRKSQFKAILLHKTRP